MADDAPPLSFSSHRSRRPSPFIRLNCIDRRRSSPASAVHLGESVSFHFRLFKLGFQGSPCCSGDTEVWPFKQGTLQGMFLQGVDVGDTQRIQDCPDNIHCYNSYDSVLENRNEGRRLAGGQKYMGALFFSLVNVMFSGMAELVRTIFRLPVFYKQRDFLFYPAWAFGLPIWLSRIPISLVESGIWITLTYYTIGFAPSPSRFFCQYLALFSVHQMALSLFLFLAAVGRIQIVASTLGTFVLLVIFVLGGFIISKDDLVPWMVWGYYLSPMMYGQNDIAINEFLDKRWRDPIGDNRPHETTVG